MARKHRGGHHPNSAAISTPERIAQLWELYDKVLVVLLQVMTRAVETGETPRASMLSVVSSFLRDNGIDADALRDSTAKVEAMAGLAQEFGQITIDEETGNVVSLSGECLPMPTDATRDDRGDF